MELTFEDLTMFPSIVLEACGETGTMTLLERMDPTLLEDETYKELKKEQLRSKRKRDTIRDVLRSEFQDKGMKRKQWWDAIKADPDYQTAEKANSRRFALLSNYLATKSVMKKISSWAEPQILQLRLKEENAKQVKRQQEKEAEQVKRQQEKEAEQLRPLKALNRAAYAVAIDPVGEEFVINAQGLPYPVNHLTTFNNALKAFNEGVEAGAPLLLLFKMTGQERDALYFWCSGFVRWEPKPGNHIAGGMIHKTVLNALLPEVKNIDALYHGNVLRLVHEGREEGRYSALALKLGILKAVAAEAESRSRNRLGR